VEIGHGVIETDDGNDRSFGELVTGVRCGRGNISARLDFALAPARSSHGDSEPVSETSYCRRDVGGNGQETLRNLVSSCSGSAETQKTEEPPFRQNLGESTMNEKSVYPTAVASHLLGFILPVTDLSISDCVAYLGKRRSIMCRIRA
jgi:hypothetical protein